MLDSREESAPPRPPERPESDGALPPVAEVTSTEIASCPSLTGKMRSGATVSLGVSARRTGLLGYHATISPVYSENVDLVVGHSIDASCVSRADAKPSLYAPSAGDRFSMA